MTNQEVLAQIQVKLAETYALMELFVPAKGIAQDLWEHQKEKLEQITEDMPTFKPPRT